MRSENSCASLVISLTEGALYTISPSSFFMSPAISLPLTFFVIKSLNSSRTAFTNAFFCSSTDLSHRPIFENEANPTRLANSEKLSAAKSILIS